MSTRHLPVLLVTHVPRMGAFSKKVRPIGLSLLNTRARTLSARSYFRLRRLRIIDRGLLIIFALRLFAFLNLVLMSVSACAWQCHQVLGRFLNISTDELFNFPIYCKEVIFAHLRTVFQPSLLCCLMESLLQRLPGLSPPLPLGLPAGYVHPLLRS